MTHPAMSMSVTALKAGLYQAATQGYINIKTKDDLTLFNYTDQCTFNKAWNPYTLSARGLVLCEPQNAIVALPFPKFFNYGETNAKVPKGKISVTEKYDGSLGIIYYWKDKWHVATRGSFDSEQAQWAEKYLHEHCKIKMLDHSDTYLVEIIYPANRIVVSYPYQGLVLLAGYNQMTGEELYIDPDYSSLGFMVPTTQHYDIGELLELAKNMKADKEGFVVRFEDGSRIKIKGAEYCRIHKLISRITPLGVWESMMTCKDHRHEIPEEFLKDYDDITTLLQLKFASLVATIDWDTKATQHLDNKQLGLLIQQPGNKFSKFIFSARKPDFFEDICKPGSIREKLFKTFRPDGNVLEGYTRTKTLEGE